LNIILRFPCVRVDGVTLLSLKYPSIGYWILLAIVLLSLFVLIAIYIWEWRLSNKKWVFRTSEIPNLDGQYFNRANKIPFGWRSLKSQKQGMFYEIDFGRNQNIKGVQFDHGYSFETPKKWRMWFYNKASGFVFPCGHKHPYITTGDPETGQNTTAIIVKLNQPIGVRKIRVEVSEPEIFNHITQHWRVQAVFLEVKILHGLKSHIIGRFFLDGL